jgi:DNA repair photolyase
MNPLLATPVEALSLVERINRKYKRVWDQFGRTDQIVLAQYFLPHHSRKPVLGPTRPRIVKWYCPFAAQDDFPSGHRYCINVYTGCDHKCVYCYASAYEPTEAGIKANFERLIVKDMEDLELFDVPPAPVHLSNSVDPFQPLEMKLSHTKYALEQILAHRHRFTTVTILTKNPLMTARQDYLDLFKKLIELPAGHPKRNEFTKDGLPGFVVEASLAFWRETARIAYDPCAPAVEQRIEGIRALHEARIPLVLRIDPLFPRSPITERPLKSMVDFGLPEAQTMEDLENLVGFAEEMSVRHVVFSAAKIVQPRGRKLSETMRTMRSVYEAFAAPEKLVWRGGSWRLPQSTAEAKVVRPLLEICKRIDVPAKFCKQNLIETL